MSSMKTDVSGSINMLGKSVNQNSTNVDSLIQIILALVVFLAFCALIYALIKILNLLGVVTYKIFILLVVGVLASSLIIHYF